MLLAIAVPSILVAAIAVELVENWRYEEDLAGRVLLPNLGRAGAARNKEGQPNEIVPGPGDKITQLEEK